MRVDAYATLCIMSTLQGWQYTEVGVVALGDAILACLTERPMTGYELAKTFDASIGFFWKANHQQIYRELSRLRERGHIQGREVVQSGKPNKLVYTLTAEGRAALKHWAARPSIPPSIKDDLLVRLCALDSVDIEPLRADLMARQEYHRDRFVRYERILKKRFPQGTASPADTGKLLGLRIGLRHERIVAEWCEEALEALSALTNPGNVVNPGHIVALEGGQHKNSG
jgi:DNA-binding PadR family transcriptional regulator